MRVAITRWQGVTCYPPAPTADRRHGEPLVTAALRPHRCQQQCQPRRQLASGRRGSAREATRAQGGSR
jgi:hypothetical protein